MSIQVVTARELKAELEADPDLQIVDVRLAEDYQAAHLPNAANNCVFEVRFMDRMEEHWPDKRRTICVYGEANSHESQIAAEKLRRAGYASILDFRGGPADWEAAGGDLNIGEALEPEHSVPDGDFEIDLNESYVEWSGRNLLSKHHGRIALQSGDLCFKGGKVAGGEFVLDMKSITCTNLEGSELHDVLIHHLKSDDFFDIEHHPQAQFVIRSGEPVNEGRPGTENLKLTGDLTLKGETHPVDFSASAGFTHDGHPAAQARFAIDRTKWNILYGSSQFFNRLGMHLVNDHIELDLRIVTKR